MKIATPKAEPSPSTQLRKTVFGGSLAFSVLLSLATGDRLLATPLFMTHHAPVGAWSSMTFGLPGGGIGIDTEALATEQTGSLVVACSWGNGRTVVLPFFAANNTGNNGNAEGQKAGNAAPAGFRSWKMVSGDDLKRQLTPATDEYTGSGIRFSVISPRFDLPDPAAGGDIKLASLPAILLEVEIDNTGEDQPATGFLGLAYTGIGRLRPLNWSDDKLVGVALSDRWALAGLAGTNAFTIRAKSIAPFVEAGKAEIHPGGNQGGIAFRIAPRSRGKLTAVLGFYRSGQDVTPGMPSSYAYTHNYGRVEDVCLAALKNADLIKTAAKKFDDKLTPPGCDPVVSELMAQASQGYYANTSLVRDAKDRFFWSVCEGQYAWRNTLDLAVDHLPFELTVHPWVSRNVLDSFIETYSYQDTVRFDGETVATHPGGISFCHDEGNYTAYSPPGQSGYEESIPESGYAFMTTEQLLNGAYCAATWAIKGNDPAWRHRQLPLAREILASMENREHFDPAKRDGILRAQSSKVKVDNEITTYDALDESLKNSRGSVYIVVKTWGAALMLARWFEAEKDPAQAQRALALATRAAASLEAAFQKAGGRFPPNLLDGGDSMVLAALEPLAVPLFCGMENDLQRFPTLIEVLRTHGRNCLKPGVCLDAKTGGVRLSSLSENTWPSKVALTLAVLQWLEKRPIDQLAPTAIPEFARWLQVSAAKTTISDQINAATHQQIGGAYYPRLVTLQMLLPDSSKSK